MFTQEKQSKTLACIAKARAEAQLLTNVHSLSEFYPNFSRKLSQTKSAIKARAQRLAHALRNGRVWGSVVPRGVKKCTDPVVLRQRYEKKVKRDTEKRRVRNAGNPRKARKVNPPTPLEVKKAQRQARNKRYREKHPKKTATPAQLEKKREWMRVHRDKAREKDLLPLRLEGIQLVNLDICHGPACSGHLPMAPNTPDVAL